MPFDASGVAELCSAIVGVGAAGSALWRYVVKPSTVFVKRMYGLAAASEKHFVLLDEIHKEFQPNSGHSLRDVIDRIENHSASARGRITALINYHDVAAFETDSEGNFVWVSRRWCDLTDLIPPTALGNGWLTGVHEADRERVSAEWRRAVEQKREFSATFRIGNVNTGYTKVLGTSLVLKSARGEVIGYTGTLALMTEAVPNKKAS